MTEKISLDDEPKPKIPRPKRGYSYPKKHEAQYWIYFPTKKRWYSKKNVNYVHNKYFKDTILGFEEEIKYLISEKFQPVGIAISMMGIKKERFDIICTRYNSFAEAINQAASMTIANALDNMMTMPRGWEKYTWILERLFPEQFAKPTDRDHDKACREEANNKKQEKLVNKAKREYDKIKKVTEKKQLAIDMKKKEEKLKEQEADGSKKDKVS